MSSLYYSINRLWLFSVTYKSGEVVNYGFKVCVRPNRTKMWKDMVYLLDSGVATTISYELHSSHVFND